MKNYNKKWNNYEIENIKWINLNKDHLCRYKFVDYVEKENIKDIVEVGGGELIEARKILSNNYNISYVVVDVSDTFLDFAKTIDRVEGIKGDMINIPLKDKQVDLIYCSSVLEHSPDIRKTIKEMSRISNRFYFNMFKWKMKTGDLISVFRHKKQYYSTTFNIDALISLIREYGNIDKLIVYDREKVEEKFSSYRENNVDIDINRNGKYLAIIGSWVA